ncbi:MAG TPA: hypothetical protein DCR21_00465 [Succinivibrionaceae bacterium]|nr:hypothetical protein [Succinivibrionaceae bacterium]
MNFFCNGVDFKRIIPCFQKYDEHNKIRTRNYCWLFKSEYNLAKVKGQYYKFFFLGICVWLFDIGPEGKFIYIFNKKIRKLNPDYPSLFYILKDYVSYKLGIRNFNIVSLFCNTGELNYLCHFMHGMDRLNKLEKKVYVYFLSANRQILNLYKIKEPGLVVPVFFYRLGFCESNEFNYSDGTECYKLIDYQFFHRWDYMRINYKLPLVDALNEYYGLYKIKPRLAEISDEDRTVVDVFLKKNVGDKPFILINNETTTGSYMIADFWKTLIRCIQKKGFVCMINTKNNPEYKEVCEQCFFDYPKTKYLASLAYASVGTRCGFTAIISEDCRKIITFVKKIGRVGGELSLVYWPVSKNVNAHSKEIHEINAEFLSNEELIDEILSKL